MALYLTSPYHTRIVCGCKFLLTLNSFSHNFPGLGMYFIVSLIPCGEDDSMGVTKNNPESFSPPSENQSLCLFHCGLVEAFFALTNEMWQKRYYIIFSKRHHTLSACQHSSSVEEAQETQELRKKPASSEP